MAARRWGLVARHQEGRTASPSTAAVVGWNGRLAPIAGGSL